ncbi:MAG: efflux RND transporter periplasmic adaptor subunit [Gammaproteobacteria bacterium]|nr:efflux RND transporter periplasmic adaptor subunit [Gammaproteobacteria bacterium]
MADFSRKIANTATVSLLAAAWVLGPAVHGADSSGRYADLSATYDCLVEPNVITNVGSPVQGVIESLTVDRSDIVKAGQPIAQLRSDVERANLTQAKARAKMESEINARLADLELAKNTMQRMQNLHDQKIVPAQQRDEAEAQLHVAKAALDQARENHELLQHELSRAEATLAQHTIRSPVDGVVVEQRAFPGEFVYENPVMTIAQLDPLRVEVILPARLFGLFKLGDIAKVYPEIGTAEPLIAEVDVVDRLLDTRSGTFGVRLKLPNPDFAIPGGQKCSLVFQQRTDLVAVSDEAASAQPIE